MTLVIYVFSWWLFFFIPHWTNQAPLNNWCPMKESNRITPVHLVHWLDCNDRKIIISSSSSSSRSLAICLPYNLDCCMLDCGCQIIRYFLRCWKDVLWHRNGVPPVTAAADCHIPNHSRTGSQIRSFGLQLPFAKLLCACVVGNGLRDVGEIGFDFRILRLLPIRFTQQNWCCISISTMKHLRNSGWGHWLGRTGC